MAYQDQIKQAQAGPGYARAREAAAGMGFNGQVIAVVRDGQFTGFHAVRSIIQPHGIRPQVWLTEYRGQWVIASGPEKELELKFTEPTPELISELIKALDDAPIPTENRMIWPPKEEISEEYLKALKALKEEVNV